MYFWLKGPIVRIVTLSSDFGTTDTAVSTAKATIQKQHPSINIIDVTHRITQDDFLQASWICKSAYRNFPEGTIHVISVSIFAGSKQKLLLLENDGHFFLGPDNEIFSLMFGENTNTAWLCASFTNNATIHGWFLEVNVAIENVINVSDLSTIYPSYNIVPVSVQSEPKVVANGLDCNILYIDRYGNIIINITEKQFLKQVGNRPFSIKIPGETEEKQEIKNKLVGTPYIATTISKHYNEVAEDRLLCRFNSLGYMEVAINRRSAAQKLELQESLMRNILYRSITISFNHS